MDKDYVSLTQFENNPALKKEFGGDYQAYLRAYIQQIQQTPLFELELTNSFKNLPNSIPNSVFPSDVYSAKPSANNSISFVSEYSEIPCNFASDFNSD